MKKIPILFLSILISGLLFAPISSISAMMEDIGTTWWTVEELLEFYQEVEQEKELECGDNQDCRMEFDFSMYEKGPKYSALESFMQGQFWITSVNPAEETIKVLFFDEDMMLRHMGIEEKLELEHLYIAWFENWKSQVYNEDYEHFYDGYLEGMHTMYAGISSIYGPGWIPAWEEVELSVAGSNLIENMQGIITFSVFAEDNMFNAQGSTNYLNCLRQPDYSYGTECKMYVSGDKGMSFFPPREQLIEQAEENTTTEIPTEEPSTEPTEPEVESEITEPDQTESGTEPSEPFQPEQVAPITETKPTILSPSTPVIKAPETGTNTHNNESTQSIGWFVGLGVIGVMLIVWWFMPTEYQKNRKKSEKNRKRVLTKNPNCDKMISV